jgi:DNA-binding transcriptional MerR regulator
MDAGLISKVRGDRAVFSTSEAAAMSGMAEKTLRTWMSRGMVAPSGRTAAGRRRFNLLDGIRLAVTRHLIEQVRIPATGALGIASRVVDDIVAAAEKDSDGSPLIGGALTAASATSWAKITEPQTSEAGARPPEALLLRLPVGDMIRRVVARAYREDAP